MKNFKKLKGILLIALYNAPSILLAQGGVSVTDAVGTVLGIIIVCSTIWAIITAWGGVQRIKEGDPTGYNSLWAAGFAIIVPLLVLLLYRMFFSGAPQITPQFNFGQ